MPFNYMTLIILECLTNFTWETI